MRHPSESVLRRLVDEPAGVADADRAHAGDCAACLATLAAVRTDAVRVGGALGAETSPPPEGAEAAWRRLSSTVTGGEPAPVSAVVRLPRWRTVLRSPAVAAVGVVALVAGAGAAAAGDWLPIFTTQQIAPVTVSDADLVHLPDLSAYGTLAVTERPRLRSVPDAAAARRATDLDVPEVTDLPTGVAGTPTYEVGDRTTAEFTFSADAAARAAEAVGETLPEPPPGLDGSRFRLSAGPGVAEVWSESQGLPALAVARAVAPIGYSTGVPFRTARDYLLSLPGIPDDVAAQLRGFSGDATTLPLAVPERLAETSTVDLDGVSATVLESRDQSMAGVIWVEGGVVTAVAGSLSTDEVLAVARGLR